MKSNSTPASEPSNSTSPANEKVIEWEDFEQELARLWSLSSALKEAKEKKQILQNKLDSLIKETNESLSRSNELEVMRDKVERRKSLMQNMSLRTTIVAEDAKKKEEELGTEVGSLLGAGTALSVSRKRLQESSKVLDGPKGFMKLKNLQKMLRMRQQYMVSQVSLLYPVKITVGKAQDQELESLPNSTRSGCLCFESPTYGWDNFLQRISKQLKMQEQAGNSAGSKPVNHESLTIIGLQLTMLPFTKMSFFTDKKEVQKSATALGYVGHAVSLIASYMQVPLRYPVRFGGSHSYILDKAPSLDAASSESSATAESTNLKQAEFPLFLEGQDTTRAAYAVFLLNKDLEQLLNYIGVKSLGPRYVLANLKELQRRILSADYIDM